MLALNNTTETLILETRIASATDYLVCYADHMTTTFSPNNTQGSISTVANTTILTAPSAGTQRTISFISIRNKGAGNTTVVLKVNNSPTVAIEYHLGSPFSLRTGESLVYSKTGFRPFHANGTPYAVQQVGTPTPSIKEPPGQALSALTGTKVIHAGGYSYAAYLGRAPFSFDGIKLACNVTTVGVSTTWEEIAIAKGAVVMNGSPTLTVLGFADVTSIVTSTGAKNIQINITPPNYVTEHDDLWIIFGGAAGTGMQYRATTVADNVGAGFFHSALTRPSLNVGVGVLYTIDDVVIGTNSFPIILVQYT